MSKIAASLLLVGFAAAGIVPQEYCLVQWWPKTCEAMPSDNCLEWGGVYSSLAACGHQTPNTDGWCVSTYFPASCVQVADGPCYGSEYPLGGWASEDACIAHIGVTGEDAGGNNPGPSDPDMTWCISQWWPRTCTEDFDECETGSEYFYNQTSCMSQNSGPSSADMTWCISQWWPRECTEDFSDCETGSEYFANETSCMAGLRPENMGEGWCVTSWFLRTCGVIGGEVNCSGSEYPAGGWVSEAECEMNFASLDVGASAEAEDHTGKYCYTQWWPRDCMQIASQAMDGCVANTLVFETEEECWGEYEPIPGPGQGWCVTTWWTASTGGKVCGLVADGACMGWYPEGGWSSEAACMG